MERDIATNVIFETTLSRDIAERDYSDLQRYAKCEGHTGAKAGKIEVHGKFVTVKYNADLTMSKEQFLINSMTENLPLVYIRTEIS